jgi:hypothetical protein
LHDWVKLENIIKVISFCRITKHKTNKWFIKQKTNAWGKLVERCQFVWGVCAKPLYFTLQLFCRCGIFVFHASQAEQWHPLFCWRCSFSNVICCIAHVKFNGVDAKQKPPRLGLYSEIISLLNSWFLFLSVRIWDIVLYAPNTIKETEMSRCSVYGQTKNKRSTAS